MKFASYIIGLTLLTATSCNSQVNQNQGQAYGSPTSSDQLIMKTVSDQQGKAILQMPLPQSWNIQGNAIVGPNNLEIKEYQGQSFVYTPDPYYAQAYAQAGKQIRQPAGLQAVVNQDIRNMGEKIGLTYEKAYPLPRLAQADRAYSNQLVSYGNPQKNFDVAGVEWSKDGKKILVIVHYYEQNSQGLSFWGYYTKALECDAAYFEEAKKSYLYALENVQHNQARISAYNQRESAALQQRDAAFQTRMRSNNESFQATQRAYRESQNAINEAQMGIYRSQSESFDRGNQQITNTIHGENTLYNPTNGETYQTEGYYDNYWMNSDGQYIGTDDQFYDPNMDPNYDNTEWQQGVDPY